MLHLFPTHYIKQQRNNLNSVTVDNGGKEHYNQKETSKYIPCVIS